MARIGAEERRQDFIEATIKVIAEHGIANATTRRIAAAADSPLASLHYVFHTKEELFYSVYESLINMPQQSLQAPADALPADSVGDMLRQLVKWFIAHPERAITQFELFFWNLRNDPQMAAKIYIVSLEATQQAIQKATGDALDHAARTTAQSATDQPLRWLTALLDRPRRPRAPGSGDRNGLQGGQAAGGKLLRGHPEMPCSGATRQSWIHRAR